MGDVTVSDPASSAIDRRTGLTDDIAYLREEYPRPIWHAHRNFGQLAAFWLETHDALRGYGDRLGRATADFREGRSDVGSFRAAMSPQLDQFLRHLNGHHQIEDAVYFPKFRALDRRMIAGFDLLEADHGRIHIALLAVAKSGRSMLERLKSDPRDATGAADGYASDAERMVSLLRRHLDDEEDLIVPAILHHGERRLH